MNEIITPFSINIGTSTLSSSTPVRNLVSAQIPYGSHFEFEVANVRNVTTGDPLVFHKEDSAENTSSYVAHIRVSSEPYVKIAKLYIELKDGMVTTRLDQLLNYEFQTSIDIVGTFTITPPEEQDIRVNHLALPGIVKELPVTAKMDTRSYLGSYRTDMAVITMMYGDYELYSRTFIVDEEHRTDEAAKCIYNILKKEVEEEATKTLGILLENILKARSITFKGTAGEFVKYYEGLFHFMKR